MLPLRFFRSRAFSATSVVSLAMSFGIFGSIFLLAQFFQTVWGYSPLEAGLRTLPWTGMPMLVAPIAGALSDRIGSRPLMAAGLGLQAVAIVWLGAITSVDVALHRARPGVRARRHRHGAGVLAGRQRDPRRGPAARGRARRAAPTTRSASSAASSASRCWRRCSARSGGYQSGQAFVDGLQPALFVGAAVLAAGAVAALLVPGKPREAAGPGRRSRAGPGVAARDEATDGGSLRRSAVVYSSRAKW